MGISTSELPLALCLHIIHLVNLSSFPSMSGSFLAWVYIWTYNFMSSSTIFIFTKCLMDDNEVKGV